MVVPVHRMTFAEVVQPVSDLRLALVFGAHAVVRLVAGVVQVARQALSGPRVTAEERACTRHGAMT